MAKCGQDGASELPNLFLATTYALNKSNSKRLCIGLEYTDGYFHEVVKLVSSGGWHKTVTLDAASWDIFKDQFATISSYFANSYSFFHEYGSPHKIFLPRHDLSFTSSYGTKSVLIDERPANNANTKQNSTSQSDEPDCKKRKTSAPPSIVMQQTTFDWLHKQSTLVDLALQSLKESVGKANRTLDLIIEFLKEKMGKKEEEENTILLLSSMKGFQAFYAVFNAEIEAYVLQKLPTDEHSDRELQLILAEISAFGLPLIMKELRIIFTV